MTLKCIIWPRPILMCLATRWRCKWRNGGLSHRLWSRRDGKQDMLDTPRAKMCSLTKKKYIMAPWSCLHFSVRGEETHFFILCLSEAVCYLKGDTTMCILFFFYIVHVWFVDCSWTHPSLFSNFPLIQSRRGGKTRFPLRRWRCITLSDAPWFNR